MSDDKKVCIRMIHRDTPLYVLNGCRFFQPEVKLDVPVENEHINLKVTGSVS